MTSHSRAISRSKKNLKFVEIMAETFLNCESACNLLDVLASIYDRKMAARLFDIIHDILRSLSLAQSLLEGRNAPIWRTGNRGVKLRARNFSGFWKLSVRRCLKPHICQLDKQYNGKLYN